MKTTKPPGGTAPKPWTHDYGEEARRVAGRTSWVEVDAALEVRERLVVIADTLDAGDVGLARAAVDALLQDLDAVSTPSSVPSS